MARPIPANNRQKRNPQREEKRDRGAERDEHVHVGRPALERCERPLVEARTTAELHGHGEDEHEDVGGEHLLDVRGIGHKQGRECTANAHMGPGKHTDAEDDDGKYQGGDEDAAVVPRTYGFPCPALLVNQRRIIVDELRGEREVIEDAEHVIDRRRIRIEGDLSGVVGEVHRDVDDARRVAVMLLDIGRAVRAMHAIDGQAYRALHERPFRVFSMLLSLAQ